MNGVARDDAFVKIVFHGDRFDGGVIPVEVLSELAAYKDVVVAAAKGLFRSRHPERTRVPKGYEDSIRLVFTGSVEGGSAVANIDRIWGDKLPIGDEVNDAVELVEGWLRAVAEDAEFPDELRGVDRERVEVALGRWGRSLHEDEAMETRTDAHEAGIKFNQRLRRRLAERTGRDVEFTYENWAALVTEVTTHPASTFTLDLGGHGIHGGLHFLSGTHDPLTLDVDGPPIPVTVSFTARVEPSGRIKSILSVDSLSVEDELPESSTSRQRFSPPDREAFESAITDLAVLEDGWMEGIGHAPTPEAMRWVLEVIPQFSEAAHLPLPWVYPTPDGGIQCEWEVGEWRASAVFDSDEQVVRLFATSIGARGFSEDERAAEVADASYLTSFFERAGY